MTDKSSWEEDFDEAQRVHARRELIAIIVLCLLAIGLGIGIYLLGEAI